LLYRGTKVALAGAFINFALGLFYAWSVFAEGLTRDYGWTKAAAALPYTCELLLFSITMFFAGHFQDRLGPRLAALICGLSTGVALILCSFAISPAGLTLLFGVLFGAASAFGYAAATPAALKWFPPEKRGFITGAVIMPMGAGALLWSPAVKLMINQVGLRGAFQICGLFLLAGITLAARAIRLPREGEVPFGEENEGASASGIGWRLLLGNPLFVLLWLMLGLSAGTGLMFIGQLVQVAAINFHVPWGYLLVSLFALTSTLGRFGGGLLCDRIGCLHSIRVSLFMLAAAMLLFFSGWGSPALVAATLLLGSGYGSVYTSFPNAVGRLFGLEHFGFIYGLLFTAVGVAGFFGPMAAAALADRFASYAPAFLIGLAATLLCYGLSIILQRRLQTAAAAPAVGAARAPERARKFKQRD